MKTAILVDGGFYRYRAQACLGDKTAKERADELFSYCLRHLSDGHQKVNMQSELYRILYYDCAPSSKNVYHPLLKRQINLGKTELYTWTNEFFEELKKNGIKIRDFIRKSS